MVLYNTGHVVLITSSFRLDRLCAGAVCLCWCYLFVFQGVKGELLKLAGSLVLVYGADDPEVAGGARTMLGWCDSALDNNAKNKRVSCGRLRPFEDCIVCACFFHVKLVFPSIDIRAPSVRPDCRHLIPNETSTRGVRLDSSF